MEALPRLPMLSFDLKHSPEYVEFGPTLKQYIKNHYGEDPALYNKACTDLEQLRQAAIQVSRDVMGCTTLKKYYAQLQYLQGRFPMAEGGEAAIAFTWEDIQTGRDHLIYDIKFEQACILYNIGSLHSLLGALDTGHNAEGMKVSCTHFQCAAWAFELLRNNFSSTSMSTDMSFELLNFHITLMLAQAQECILEKSIFDNRKNSITAKVAAKVVEFYKEASSLIDVADSKQQMNSRMHKEWSRRLTMKTAFYQSITYYYLGREAEEVEKPGECLAYLTAAKEELNKATQLAKNEVSEVLDSLHFAKDVILGKYESAKKDNDFVYHAKVPSIDSLPEIKGACLVKGIPFDPADKDISGPDIFQKLVPMEAHEASSVYSEEKAKLSRTVIGEVEQKNMELDQFMSSLQFDLEHLMPKPNIMPDNLMEKCAAMSVRTNAIKELTDSMTSVSGLATEVELSLEEIQQLINEDNEKTQQMETQYGKKNPSSVLPKLQDELVTYRQRHEEGNQLNTALHKAMNTHTNNLKILVLPPSEINNLLPPAQPILSAEDDVTVTELRKLMQKVTEMKEQRQSLVEQFREKLHKDDITNVLVTQEVSDKQSVFKEQLKKHDQIVTYIRQNMSAQDNILRHLTDVNAKFALIRQAFTEATAKREKAVQDLILSYEKYEELLAKSQKGSEYYKKLLENITRTLERCRSECKVRHEEREMLLTKFAPKAAAPSRPSAPKPVTNSQETPPNITSSSENTLNSYLPGEDISSLPPLDMHSPVSFQNLPASFEGPKLKDFLPFMKPRSFGPKSGPALPQETAPSPTLTADIPSFGSSYDSTYEDLASVLPATIAQYLASKSSGISTSAGGARLTPSPQQGSAHGSPRHSSAYSQQQQQNFVTGPGSSALPPAGQQNMQAPFNNYVSSQRFPEQLPASAAQQISQYSLPPGSQQPYSNSSMNIVTSVREPISSSGIDSMSARHQYPLQIPPQQQAPPQGHMPAHPAHGSSHDPNKPQQWPQNQFQNYNGQSGYQPQAGLNYNRPAAEPTQGQFAPNSGQYGQSHGYIPQHSGQIPSNQSYIPPGSGQIPPGLSYIPSGTGQSAQMQSYIGVGQVQIPPVEGPTSLPFSSGQGPEAHPGHGHLQPGFGGSVSQIPGRVNQMPSQVTQMPGQVNQMTGQVNQIPGQVVQMPGQVNQITGQVSQMPGQVNQMPERVNQVPGQMLGQVTQIPGQGGSTQVIPTSHGYNYLSQVSSHPYGNTNYSVQSNISGDKMANGVQGYQAQPGQSYQPYIQPAEQQQTYPQVPANFNNSPHQSPTRNADYSKQVPGQVKADPSRGPFQQSQNQAGFYQNGQVPYSQAQGPTAQNAISLQASGQGGQLLNQYQAPQNFWPQKQSLNPQGLSQTSLPPNIPQTNFQLPPNQVNMQPHHAGQNLPVQHPTVFQNPAQDIQQQGPQGGQLHSAMQPLPQPLGPIPMQTQQFSHQPVFQQIPAQPTGGHVMQQPQSFPQQPPQAQPSNSLQQHQPLPVGHYGSQQGFTAKNVAVPSQPNVHPQMPQPLQPSSKSSTIRPSTPVQVATQPPAVVSHVPTTPTSPTSTNKMSVSRQSSSLDDILSSSPNGVKDTIISPQVLTDQERQLQKEEAIKNQALTPITEPYSSQSAIMRLLADVETFGKFVDELSVTILGVSRLDTLWKSLLDSQDAATKKQSMAIARCYPIKNRDPDIMPYDETRVVLTSTKDDYINANWLNDLAPSCPKFITTQAPKTCTISDYWAMVYEQGSEVLVQITSEYETGKNFPVYYPIEKDKTVEQGVILLSLQSVKFRQHWVERIIYLKNTQTKQGRTMVHLQFKNWPVSGFPDEIGSIVSFISEVHNFYLQQRSLTKPIIVHCGLGIGRTGVFTLVYTAMQEILHGNGLVDLPGLAKRMLQKRRGILNKKEQIKCCYDAVLFFSEEYLEKRGMLVKNPHYSKKQLPRQSPKHQPHQNPAQDDIVLGSVDLQTIRENVGKLHVQAHKVTDSSRKEDFSLPGSAILSKRSSITSLPDVVQQYTESGLGDKSCSSSSVGSDISSFGNLHSDLGAAPGVPSQDPTKPASQYLLDGSKRQVVMSDPGSLPSSLAQLQDPATFTMGSPDAKKKNKITKANFSQSQGFLQSGQADPSDPLGSLDPLWTLTKK